MLPGFVSKYHRIFAFAHPGNSKPTAVGLLRLVWHILTSGLAFLVHLDMAGRVVSVHEMGHTQT